MVRHPGEASLQQFILADAYVLAQAQVSEATAVSLLGTVSTAGSPELLTRQKLTFCPLIILTVKLYYSLHL